MIAPDRFLERSCEPERWHAARARGVTATAVAKAATDSGFRDVIENRPVVQTPEMLFGLESEAELMRYAQSMAGILASDWLIAAEGNSLHMATPDGISSDHLTLAECKTGGTVPKSVPRIHRDQCQWSMYCTGAERDLYLFNQRIADDHGWFFLGLIEPVTFWVDRDDARIRELVIVAQKLQEARLGELQLV